MTNAEFANTIWLCEPIVCLLTIFVICRQRLHRDFRFLVAYLSVRSLSTIFGFCLVYFAGHGIEKHLAYKAYFYLYWGSYAVESILGFMVVYTIYHLAMAPLKGLQHLGKIMFRWAGGIAVAVALGIASGPHLTQYKFIVKMVTQMQETESVLTLCLLLFVCVTASPMGLSYRSKIFGVSLGLGVIATTHLVGAAWITQQNDMYGVYSTINSLAIFLTLGIWIFYFAKKEPVRRMIVLPTTSPFLRWNQISAVLGDEPGFVVVSEVNSDLFAPAELEVMRRASVKLTPSSIAESRLAELESAAS